MPTIADLLQHAGTRLRTTSASARLDAELLLEHATGWPRSVLHAYPERSLSPAADQVFELLLARRARGEPLAYLTGRREFWSLSLEVTPDVLIPRPETETLVEQALTHLATDRAERVLDLGTGSGAIALAIAKERPSARITATDVSAAALVVAQGNARRLGIPGINFVSGDWFQPLAGQHFELIASNPPYVAAADPALERQVLEYEPTIALIPGPDGLEAVAKIIAGAACHLAPRGWLLLEHGWDQAPRVRGLLVRAGFAHVRSHTDLAGRERVTAGCWQP